MFPTWLAVLAMLVIISLPLAVIFENRSKKTTEKPFTDAEISAAVDALDLDFLDDYYPTNPDEVEELATQHAAGEHSDDCHCQD